MCSLIQSPIDVKSSNKANGGGMFRDSGFSKFTDYKTSATEFVASRLTVLLHNKMTFT